jgi:beta-glucosidase/6-phospho-beta-glucosidase/beta-galactosidase
VLPGGGRGSAVSPEGVAFYNRLLDEMEANGITPAATMFHWDLPQSLHDKVRLGSGPPAGRRGDEARLLLCCAALSAVANRQPAR